jgi:calcium-dependent protein kinase
MVLEYCSKGDLFTYMLTNYPNFGMPINEVKVLTEQVAKGISYLHKQDIIHGDIKPSNILINEKDEIKICDFGLSTKTKNKEKVNGAKGTLNYLAPECIFPYDEKVDIWALGVLIYFISTGTLPFQISTYKQLTEVLCEEKLQKF